MKADADLSPGGIAQLIYDFIGALGLSNVVIVGNDTGGAICQVMLGGDTSRLGAAVLTNCDAFGTFPPRALAPLFSALRHPVLVACMVPGLRSAWVRHGRLAFGPLTSGQLDRGLTRDWISPLARGAIRGDLARFAGAVHPRVLLDAASRFSQFTGPVRILWGEADPYFPVELAQQLSEAFPNARLTTVAAGRAFLPLDYPGEVASEIVEAVQGAPS
jgi:pimeloyl-ACP methyl ester carboxylesterase